MKNLRQWLTVGSAVSLITLGSVNLAAQDTPPPAGPPPGGFGGGGGGRGPGGFDPAQFQQRMMERIREQMEVKSDDEWKALEPLVQKVFDARREVGFGGPGGFGGGRRRGAQANDQGGGGNRRGGFGGNRGPEAEALQSAVDANASGEQIKGLLKKYRDARAAKQAALEKAQKELQQVLTVKQEAVAVLNNLLN